MKVLFIQIEIRQYFVKTWELVPLYQNTISQLVIYQLQREEGQGAKSGSWKKIFRKNTIQTFFSSIIQNNERHIFLKKAPSVKY